jgi:hypothetical protein
MLFILYKKAAVLFGAMFFGGVVYASRHDPGFMRRDYFQALAMTIALCVFVPILYSLGDSRPLVDFYLLRIEPFAWGRTLIAFLGALLGGLVALLLPRPKA